ncbi:toll/interleukin-1 receptor domain-containing protein [Oryzicola mucosus]|uniref:Toll/interleukin-1 receptor domain-containing protein n=1 Tax=Oryzicola mucosus TaxID=2767425 RepID=A0A8J6PN69_9HYPH|nr:toll/interleukin-1 receptor domain-containing protein [Oryzicola mucosus]MBD0414907.1 toll/interleukin-1 receptor domain-containing protein [Oryzicola mucosus]
MDFNGFFSYSRQDSENDPELFEEIHKEVQSRVQQRLVNANFKLWRDVKNLRLADQWSSELEIAVKRSDVFIALVSPSWMSSAICRQEYNCYLKRDDEIGEGVIPSIVSIIIRDLESQVKYFDDDQTALYADIKSRQYIHKDIVDIKALALGDRSKWVDRIADDVSGIIERRRCAGNPADADFRANPIRYNRTNLTKEFSTKAYNFEEVDFLGDHELLLKDAEDGGSKIYGQFDFVDKLYVSGESGRVEFGVRRAMLCISDKGGVRGGPTEHLRRVTSCAKYLNLHKFPGALAIGIDPPPGKTALSELALPPGPAPENRLSELGIFRSDGLDLSAVLTVSLNTEGIFIKGMSDSELSNVQLSKLDAILSVAAEKYAGADEGSINRDLEIQDDRKKR